MSKRLLFVAAIICLVVAGVLIRQNHLTAQRRANEAIAVDRTGVDPTSQLASLKAYTATHITGTSTRVVLTDGYARAQAAARATAAATAANAQVYADAQRICSGKSDSIVQARCNQDYLNKHLVALPPAGPIAEPNASDYVHVYTSPFWYPDLAGALVLGGVLVLVWLVVRMLGKKGRVR